MASTDWSVHPGEILREKLAEMGMSGSEAADRLGVTQPYVSNVLNGHKGIGPHFALKLEKLTGISAEMWVGLSARHALHVARTAQAFGAVGGGASGAASDITE